MSNFHPIKLKWLVASIYHVKYWSVIEIVTCILLTSNQIIFLVQFGINKHSQIFQRLQIFVVFEKFARAYLFQIALEIIWLPIQILMLL